MTATLLPDTDEHLLLRPDQLISLADAGVSGGAFAMRPLKKAVLEQLKLSDPKDWEAIHVTRCTLGYIVIDGYHRCNIAERKGERLKAICTPFQNDDNIIEAAFEANLRHGYAADVETRSNYAYWLHVVRPTMTQVEIARKAGIRQSTVSEAIAKREEQAKQATLLEGLSEFEQEHVKQRQHIEKSCRTFAHAAVKFLDATGALDDVQLLALLNTILETGEEKAKLARIGRLLSTGTQTGPLLRFAPSVKSSSQSTW